MRTERHQQRGCSGAKTGLACWWVALILLVRCLDSHAAEAVDGVASETPLRIGIGPGIWNSVNHQDATAAIKSWARSVLQQRKMSAFVESDVFETDEALTEALRQGRVDAVTLLTEQFLALDAKLQPETVYLSSTAHSTTERFVVLVRRDSGITNLAGLGGRVVEIQNKVRASLAPVWFRSLLTPVDSSQVKIRHLTANEKPFKSVVRVFFKQLDACVVTTNVFALSAELNPQLQQQLVVLATSPEVVPTLFFFRPDYRSPLREELEPAILGLHEAPAGQQVLTVFQTDRMTKHPISALNGTRESLETWRRAVPTAEKTASPAP